MAKNLIDICFSAPTLDRLQPQASTSPTRPPPHTALCPCSHIQAMRRARLLDGAVPSYSIPLSKEAILRTIAQATDQPTHRPTQHAAYVSMAHAPITKHHTASCIAAQHHVSKQQTASSMSAWHMCDNIIDVGQRQHHRGMVYII